MMMLDVDDFKNINDTYGHETGDKVLKKLVQVLKSNFRFDDYVCRLGGDEFVVFMVHSNEMQRKMIEVKLEKIEQELAHTEDGVPPVSVSVGVVHGSKANDIETLMNKADEAMYKSKGHGNQNIPAVLTFLFKVGAIERTGIEEFECSPMPVFFTFQPSS